MTAEQTELLRAQVQLMRKDLDLLEEVTRLLTENIQRSARMLRQIRELERAELRAALDPNGALDQTEGAGGPEVSMQISA